MEADSVEGNSKGKKITGVQLGFISQNIPSSNEN